MRGLIWMLVGLGCSGTAFAAAEQKAGFSPVCLYESGSYSEGAFVCVQKSLMLTCVSDGAHVLWKPVVDKDINDRCTAPTVQHTPPEPRFHSHRRHVAVSRIRWPIDARNASGSTAGNIASKRDCGVAFHCSGKCRGTVGRGIWRRARVCPSALGWILQDRWAILPSISPRRSLA